MFGPPEKNQKALALLYLASGPPPNAASMHKRCADRVSSRTNNKDEVVEGKFRDLNFSRSTRKTTEYSFELFLSIYRYLIFFLKF